MGAETRKALSELERLGFMLLTDPRLPSVTRLVAGEPVRGSWWSHPAGHAIFSVAGALEDCGDVAVARLVSGKLTFVHRRLWPALLGVATSREPWQVTGLSRSAKLLLGRITREGSIRTDRIAGGAAKGPGERPRAGRDLEARLLVHCEEIHTERGSHARILETWDAWAARSGFRARKLGAGEGRAEIEAILDGMNEMYGGSGTLPWRPRP